PVVGVTRRFPGGEDSERGSHGRWELVYPSEFGRQSLQLEISLTPAYREPRKVAPGQLLKDPLIGDYGRAFCWALDAAEARAEKVRAAFTRAAIRDLYDLDRFAEARADLTSEDFLQLVNLKLHELGSPPLEQQPHPLGLTPQRRRELERSLRTELPALLRAKAPSLDLERVLARFEQLWGPGPRPRP
ncbi:MAG TPA: nucleotidyl transferase AbiEii/AbiGii toxin family protein, partial [Myxococcales bacterium]|nr:nucleotidyl transferase AbiEii/AbiGii toxin family protein [Myxococcales bacterium]